MDVLGKGCVRWMVGGRNWLLWLDYGGCGEAVSSYCYTEFRCRSASDRGGS
jgi:hypothetical protein